MQDDADAAIWLRFALVPGIGPRRQLGLLQAFKTPQTALAASFYDISNVLDNEKLARSWCDAAQAAVHDSVTQALAWAQEPGCRILTMSDADYPPALLELPDAPCVLFCLGDTDLLARDALAIVGSRNATPQGLENAERFAETLSQSGMGIVSGLAAGIDAAAHRGGLTGSGGTVAFVGTGLDRVYPASNRALAHQIAEQGLIVSEFALGTAPKPENFPRRNRLIAALAKGCLVVEATIGSGSLITARQANDLGREVFAIPGSIHSPQAKGCHQLIKQGAKLVECAEDIQSELCWDSSSPQRSPSPAPATSQWQDELQGEERLVIPHMGFDAVTIDELAVRSSLTADRLCAILLGLELKGAVFALPGNRYQRRV
ncbi:DNA-processing protein DprA [Silvimonas soli]|uniref:DNA-processing protein DprA n=1 Tax=Silvimonas soli TaxID=2980100 RepID=UPI0024B327C1|nr:DNA-processing protein DprA [Silvimonas soli]